MRSWSPLRYPGGKGKMYKDVVSILQMNDLIGSNYIEPFAGGAGVAIRLLLEEKVESIFINDYDRAIYAFWYSILYSTEDFIKKIENTEINIENWKVQKEIQKNKENVSLFELGFSTFYLNRTNRSGILKAGPIGGHSQNGDYKIDCRFNKGKLIELINTISSKKNRIHISNMDAKYFIEEVDKNNTFFFIDPPYYHKGKDLYVNFYTHQDHVDLSNAINRELDNQRYILTYDKCDEISMMYDFLEFNIVELTYTLESKRKANEILFYNNIMI